MKRLRLKLAWKLIGWADRLILRYYRADVSAALASDYLRYAEISVANAIESATTERSGG